jgi:hypothetical protein
MKASIYRFAAAYGRVVVRGTTMSGRNSDGMAQISPRLDVVGWQGTDEAFQALEIDIFNYVRSANGCGMAWDEVREDIASRHADVLDSVCVHVQEKRGGGLHVLILGQVVSVPSPRLKVRTEIRDWHGSDEDFKAVEKEICEYVRTSHAYGQSWREIREDIRGRYASLFCFVSLEVEDMPEGDIHVDFVAAVRTSEMED